MQSLLREVSKHRVRDDVASDDDAHLLDRRRRADVEGVVALELTGQLSLQLPLLVATTSAFLASSALGSA